MAIKKNHALIVFTTHYLSSIISTRRTIRKTIASWLNTIRSCRSKRFSFDLSIFDVYFTSAVFYSQKRLELSAQLLLVGVVNRNPVLRPLSEAPWHILEQICVLEDQSKFQSSPESIVRLYPFVEIGPIDVEPCDPLDPKSPRRQIDCERQPLLREQMILGLVQGIWRRVWLVDWRIRVVQGVFSRENGAFQTVVEWQENLEEETTRNMLYFRVGGVGLLWWAWEHDGAHYLSRIDSC